MLSKPPCIWFEYGSVHVNRKQEKTRSNYRGLIQNNIVIAYRFVISSLYEVKENKLFTINYNTFKDYVYTKGRAFQFTVAHNIVDYINAKLDNSALTTEPQCRELAKIKVYEKDAHQKEADDKS